MDKTRTVIIDGIEIQTSLTGVEIADLEQKNKELIQKIKFNEKSRRKMQQSLMKQIDTLEQQVKKQQEVIDRAIAFYEKNKQECVIGRTGEGKLRKDYYLPAHLSKTLINILKEVSE